VTWVFSARSTPPPSRVPYLGGELPLPFTDERLFDVRLTMARGRRKGDEGHTHKRPTWAAFIRFSFPCQVWNDDHSPMKADAPRYGLGSLLRLDQPLDEPVLHEDDHHHRRKHR
jgi:hypothetical protein